MIEVFLLLFCFLNPSKVRDMPALKTNSSFVSLKLIRDEEIMRAGRTRAAGLKPVRLLLFTTVIIGKVVQLKCTKVILFCM